MKMNGFITFEGGDGSGKTTQVQQLAEFLGTQGKDVLVTREPGGTELGLLIRRLLLEVSEQAIVPTAELLLYLADRAQHVRQVIQPALDLGQIVLCDRFTDSTLAYQGYGRGINLALLQQLNSLADGGCRPSLTFLLDCPVEAGLQRAMARRARVGTAAPAEDRFEREQLAFHEQVRAGFLALAAAEADRFHVIDAAQSMKAIAREVRETVMQALNS